MSAEPTEHHVDKARAIVSIVLREEEAAWGPVAKLLAQEFPLSPTKEETMRRDQKPATSKRKAAAAPRIDVGGAAARADVHLALAAALRAYQEQYSDTALKDFMRGYLRCVLY